MIDPQPVRSDFPRFAAAEGAGISRIYGGIHFASDNVEGLITGRTIARYVLEHVARSRSRAAGRADHAL